MYSANDFKTMRIARMVEHEKKVSMIKKKILISLTVLLFMFISGIYITSYADANNTEVINYQIKSGDTLWGIASNYNSEKDIREFVYHIKKINHLKSGLIRPGQTLKIPIYKKTKY